LTCVNTPGWACGPAPRRAGAGVIRMGAGVGDRARAAVADRRSVRVGVRRDVFVADCGAAIWGVGCICPRWRVVSPGWIGSLRVTGMAQGASKVSLWGRSLVLAIFQSGVDSALCRLFGGTCVLPLGFFRPCTRACTCSRVCVDCPRRRPHWTLPGNGSGPPHRTRLERSIGFGPS
jgi:hypothetical protein